MKESHREGLANHSDPESCVGDRKVVVEALTGAHSGQPLSCEIRAKSGRLTLLRDAESNIGEGAIRKPKSTPTQSETLCTCGNSKRGTREVPGTPLPDGGKGRSEKGNARTSDEYVSGKSDDPIVPQKQPNNGGENPPAEAVEGRGSTKGNVSKPASHRT